MLVWTELYAKYTNITHSKNNSMGCLNISASRSSASCSSSGKSVRSWCDGSSVDPLSYFSF